ncbi:MAG: SprT family zinc-dependent metalloprotease [Sporomusaceae bacterium]|nr:SprT family zinc-dependent metalloprotease [Sporomusaceae bacterium]
MNISLNGQPFSFDVVFVPRRKTLLLRVVSARQLEIKAPKNYPLAQIRALLLEKTAWIISHAAHLEQLSHATVNQTIAPGQKILFQGTPHELIFHEHATETKGMIEQGAIHLYFATTLPQAPKAILAQLFQEAAQTKLRETTETWAKKIGVFPRKITLKNQKTLWGSCSSAGNIAYNWQIIMAPPQVMDYLVIHELAHLREPNHSKRFWQIVATFDPAYQKHRLWLKEKGLLLRRLFSN